MASIDGGAMRAPGARPPGPAAPHGEILAALGRSLQRVYAPITDAPLPEHLAQFVTRIEQRQTSPRPASPWH